MQNKEAISILNEIKHQYEDCVRIARSPNAEKFQKESLKDNEKAVIALEKAIEVLSKK